jgi:hypothetical protein
MSKPFALTKQNLPYLLPKLEQAAEEGGMEVIIRERKSKRSNDQNRWMRGFAADFGKHFGYDPDSAYELLMFKFCPEFIVDPETNEELRMAGHFSKKQDGSSRSTKEAAEIQDAVQVWAANLGFVWEES